MHNYSTLWRLVVMYAYTCVCAYYMSTSHDFCTSNYLCNQKDKYLIILHFKKTKQKYLMISTQRVITHWKASCVSLTIGSSYLTSNNNTRALAISFNFMLKTWFDKQRYTIDTNCDLFYVLSPMIYSCTCIKISINMTRFYWPRSNINTD